MLASLKVNRANFSYNPDHVVIRLFSHKKLWRRLAEKVSVMNKKRTNLVSTEPLWWWCPWLTIQLWSAC